MPRDITVTLADGTTHVYQGAPDNVTPEQVSARAQQEFGQSVTALDGGQKGGVGGIVQEAGRVVDKIVRGGLLGAPRTIGELLKTKEGQLDGQGGESYTPAGLLLRARRAVMPESADQALFGAMTPQEPQTSAGKYIGATGEGAVSAITGGPLKQVGKLAQVGAGTGLGSEIGAQAGGDNPLSRLLGGLVGGGAVSVVKSALPNSESIVRTATQGMTPNDWRRAKVLETTLNNMGMPHAKSQLFGKSSSLDDVVKQASANQFVRPKLLQATRGVEAGARKNLNVWEDQNLPVQVDQKRDFMAGLQQKAADREQSLLDKKNSIYKQNLPAGVEGDIYSEQYIKQLRDELTGLSKNAAAGFGSSTDGGRALAEWAADKLVTKGNGMSKMELANLYNELNAWGADRGLSGRAVRQLKDTLGSFTPEFQGARNAASTFFQSDVDPMRQGIAGDIAHSRGGPDSAKYTAADAITRVFNPKTDQSLAIKKLSEDVGGEEVGKLLREHLNQAFNSAAENFKENLNSPSHFVNLVLGTDAQRRNVEAALVESAKSQGQNPYAVRNGFRKLINAFASYGDLKMASGVDGQSLKEAAGRSALATAASPARRAYSWASDLATRKTYGQIAGMVTSKDGLTTLEAIARSKGPSYPAAVIRSMAATGSSGSNPPELQSSNPAAK